MKRLFSFLKPKRKRTLHRVTLQVNEKVGTLASSILLPQHHVLMYCSLNNIEFRDVINLRISQEFSMDLETDTSGILKAEVTFAYWRKI